MRDHELTESSVPKKDVFQDRRTALDRRALLNMDAVVDDDRRSYHERRNWRNFALKKDWWLHVKYVEKDILVLKEPDLSLIKE